MLALIRPDAWNLPLFLHVLGATVLFGTVGTVTAAGFAIRTHADHRQLLTRVAQRTYLLGVLPAFILMRIAAEWIVGKEFPHGNNEPGWVSVGFIVSDAGAILLIVVGILLAVRRQRVLLAVPILTALYLVALGVAWVAMSGKP
jgi:hypothetical protein